MCKKMTASLFHVRGACGGRRYRRDILWGGGRHREHYRDKYSLYTHRDMCRGGPELWRAFVLRIRSLSLCLSFPTRYCRFISKRASFCLSYTRLCFKLTLLSWGILRIFQPSPFKKLFPPNFSSPCSYQFFSGYITIRT